MRKPIVFILALLCLTLLASCNMPEPVPTATPTSDATATPIPPTSTPTNTPTPTETPLPEYLSVEADSLKGTELTLRFNLDGAAIEAVRELAETFNKENEYGITVHAEAAYSAEELERALEDGLETDLILADSSWLRAKNDGRFLDLSELMNSSELFADPETALMDVMLAAEDQDGAYYALPLWVEPAFLYYNATWAQELGFDSQPASLSAFYDQVMAAYNANYQDKDDGKHGTGGWIVTSDADAVMSWLLAFDDAGRTPGEMLRDPNDGTFSEAAEWLRQLFDDGGAWTSRLTEPYDYFADRYALVYSGTYADAKRQINAFENAPDHGFDNWDLMPYPRSSAADNPRIYGDAVSIAVPNGDANHIRAAWTFIEWLYADERAASLALSAGAWPVQDNDAVTKLYRNSGEDKLYQSLSQRQYLVNSGADENWLTDRLILSDGFAYIFNLSATSADIPNIWEQIGSSIAEISAVSSGETAAAAEGESNENEQ